MLMGGLTAHHCRAPSEMHSLRAYQYFGDVSPVSTDVDRTYLSTSCCLRAWWGSGIPGVIDGCCEHTSGDYR